MTSTEKLIIIFETRDSFGMAIGSDLIAMGLSFILMSWACKE